MQYLLIGDPHITKEYIPEGEKFIAWLVGLCQEHGAVPLFLGDLYHGHGLVHVEVATFWDQAFDRLLSEVGVQAVVVPGNHDCNHACTHTALEVHREKICLAWPNPIGLPTGNHKMAAIRFHRDPAQFIAEANAAYGAGYRIIVCHQEFNGAQYETGFFAPEGVDPLQFPNDLKFFSGHIHKRQWLGDVVFYPGSVRQIRTSDFGENKRIVLMNTLGDFLTFKDIEVPATVFEPFVQYLITEDNKKHLKTIKNSPRSIICFQGSEDFCRKMMAKAPTQAKVSRDVIGQAAPKAEVQESVGIPVAFQQFAKSYANQHPDLKDQIPEAVKGILSRCAVLREGQEVG